MRPLFEAFLQDHSLAVLLLPQEARHPFPKRQERASWQALPREVQEELLGWGNNALEGYPLLTATQFLAFTRTGDRKIYEVPYFERRMKLMGAVLAECLKDDGSYMDAVVDGLWLICEETSWVISAHNGSDHPGMRPAKERPLPDAQNPYIDLFAAQTAATVSYALYFLEDKLNAVSPLIVRRVRQELERRIFLPFLIRDDFWWMGMIRHDLCNWTPWILSNVMDSLLLTMEDQLRLAEGLERAMVMLDRYLACIPADGGCDEGCGYWNMAGGSLLDCLESLYLATGGQADFYQHPLVGRIGAFPLAAHIAGPYYWNFADSDAKPRLDGERLYRYGLRTGNPALRALGAQVFHERAGVKPVEAPQMNRVLFSLFHRVESCPPVAPADQVTLPNLQVYAWEKNGLYAAIKGGHNGESHNHNDVGSFLLYVDGEPAVIDAGNLEYTAKTFGPERYTLWNTRSRNHNLPLLGGVEQSAGREFAAQDARPAGQSVVMELAAAYPKEAKVSGFSRSFAMEAAGVCLRDHIVFTEPQSVEWVFMLGEKPTPLPEGMEFCGLTLTYDPVLSPQLEEIRISDERMARNFPGSIWRLSLTDIPQTLHAQTFRLKRR